jgi:hypothetical protein
MDELGDLFGGAKALGGAADDQQGKVGEVFWLYVLKLQHIGIRRFRKGFADLLGDVFSIMKK